MSLLSPIATKRSSYLPPDEDPQAKKAKKDDDLPASSMPVADDSEETFIPPPALDQENPALRKQVESPPLFVTNILPYQKADTSLLDSTQALITQFNRAFEIYSPTSISSKLSESLVATADRIFTLFNTMFPIYLPNSDLYEGHIEKTSLPENTVVAVKADIHGDWKLFKITLDHLKDNGLLDENYRCSENVHLVFLGDFTGRGKQDLQVACVLARMKIEQADQMHILKGNHEEPRFIGKDRYTSLFHYIHHTRNDECKERNQKIADFTFRLPIGLFLYTQNSQPRQYIAFTHGSLDPTVNLHPLLDGELDILVVPKLTLSNLISYQKTVSLPIESDECIKELWEKIFSSLSAFFLPNGCSTIHSSAYTWGSILPPPSLQHGLSPSEPTEAAAAWKYLFDVEEERACGAISCSHSTLAKVAQLFTQHHRITRLYRGHDHWSDVDEQTPEAPLTTRTLSWESDPYVPYKSEIVVLLFTLEQIKEVVLTMDKRQTSEAAAGSS